MRTRLRRSTTPGFSDTSILRDTRWCCADIPPGLSECTYYLFLRFVPVPNFLHRTLSTSYFNPPSRVPYSKLILVDPPIWSKEKDGQDSDVYKMVAEMTPLRRDIWKSSDDAKAWLKSRIPWGTWDERVFDVYVVSYPMLSIYFTGMLIHVQPEIRSPTPPNRFLP